ncbi:transmembrane and coiled-coil domain-containing protein 5B-like protein [Camelus ferus]|nr:transmembrane and coiled-coil domain-containing protein 5B-like protein [Camelus ferus]
MIRQEMMEIPKLEATKQNLDYLNSDLEKDLQRLDKANLVLLRKIQEKEETVQSLEREVFLSVGKAREREELIHILSEKEEALRGLEVETAKLGTISEEFALSVEITAV